MGNALSFNCKELFGKVWINRRDLFKIGCITSSACLLLSPVLYVINSLHWTTYAFQ